MGHSIPELEQPGHQGLSWLVVEIYLYISQITWGLGWGDFLWPCLFLLFWGLCFVFIPHEVNWLHVGFLFLYRGGCCWQGLFLWFSSSLSGHGAYWSVFFLLPLGVIATVEHCPGNSSQDRTYCRTSCLSGATTAFFFDIFNHFKRFL